MSKLKPRKTARHLAEQRRLRGFEDLSVKDARVVRRLLQESYEEAFNIQQALLPGEPLHLPFAEVCFKFRPAQVVGGDFLDYFQIGPSDWVGLYVGDIVGKGIAAALYSALALGTLRAINKGGESPATVIEFLNRRLGDRHVEQRFCAIQYAVLDGTTRELRFVNAGLNPRPIHITPTGCHELGGGGLPCGIRADVEYDLYTAQLNPGDSVLFSTDGLIEAQDPAGQYFDVRRLLTACEKNRHEPPEILLDRIFEAVDAFAATEIQRDDMTAAVLRLI
jgi:phosphoserine phosphatase RsbU/P